MMIIIKIQKDLKIKGRKGAWCEKANIDPKYVKREKVILVSQTLF